MAIAQPTAAVFEYGQDATHTITLNPVESVVGWTVLYEVRAYNGGTVLITKTTGTGVTTTDSANGVFQALESHSAVWSLTASFNRPR